MKMGTSQKQTISVQHRKNNNNLKVLDFEDWLPNRIHAMKSAGAVVLKREIAGKREFLIQWPGNAAKMFTENDFQEEYETVYLARFGLKCAYGFEENVGVMV